MHDMLDTVGNELPWRVSIEKSVFTIPVSEQQHCSGLRQFSCITWMASQWKNQCKFDLVCQQCEFLFFPLCFLCTHLKSRAIISLAIVWAVQYYIVNFEDLQGKVKL